MRCGSRIAWCFSFFILHLALFNFLASAGSIEKARSLLREKKYDQVDKALEKTLAQAKPPLEALRISLDAALASGRVVTAQRRITAMLRAKPTPDLLFLGGEAADRAGQTKLALARFLTYARGTKQKSEKLKSALRYLLLRNTYPAEYKRYVALFGADGNAWALGWSLLNRLLQAGEPERAVDVAGVLIERFPAPDYVSRVHRRLRSASDRGELGASAKERYLLPLGAMIKGQPSEAADLEHMFGNAARVMPAKQRVDYAFTVQARAKGPLSWGVFGHFGAMRDLPSDEAKVAAGRRFLALEPLYRDSKEPWHYEQFMTIVDESPQVFHIKGREVVSDDAIQRRFEALKAKLRTSPAALHKHLRNIQRHYLGESSPAAVAFLRKHIRILDPGLFGELLARTSGKDFEGLLAQAVSGRGYNEAVLLKAEALRWYDQAKKKDQLLATAREYMTAFPGNFDRDRVHRHVAQSSTLDVDAKINLLQEIATKGGASQPMKELVRALLRARSNAERKMWRDNRRFQAFKRELDRNRPGTDLLMRTHVALFNIRTDSRRYNAAAFRAVKAFLAGHKGRIPGAWEQTKSVQDVLAYGIFERHRALVWDNRKAACEWAELWAPRLGLGPAWAAMARRVRERGGRTTLYRIAPHYLALMRGNERGDPEVWAALRSAVNPRTDPKPLFAGHYGRMGGENALIYLANQESSMDTQFVMDEMAKIVAQRGFRFTSRSLANHLIHALYQRTGPKAKPPVTLTRALWNFYLAQEQASGQFNEMTETYVYGLYTKAGHTKEAAAHLASYFQAIRKRTVPQQIAAIASIYHSLPREEERELKPGHRLHTLLKLLAPLYEKARRADWLVCAVYSHVLDDINHVVQNWPEGHQDRQAALRLLRLQVDMVVEGTRHSGQGTSLFPLVAHSLTEAIEKADWTQASRLTRFYARILGWDGDWDKNYKERIVPVVDALRAKRAHELVYVFLVEIERRSRPSEKVSKQLALLKARVVREIPGLLPVDRRHPTYDLHMAAQALALGNEVRAWRLTAPKLRLLPEVWTTLDAEYVAWSLEQMRKQKRLKDALELAFTILLREFDLDPEIAARVSLCKGDIYSDMQNYQAARIEYEGLKNNKRYNRTEAGSRAKYRLINLLILTRDFATAEGLLERLVDSDSLETQAEAYFLYARIAFEQADYQQAKDHLKEVFKRRHDHVEARLLEGELKLLVPRGLASPEVLIGNPRLKTITVPGRTLTLKLQDPNLSVARGGAAVPVVLTTTRGRDREEVKLLPNSADKNLFTGTIATALGKVEPNNLQLELRGDDLVSYVIDPEFQKANDLNYPAKTLEVRHDARLVASAGEILTPEEAEKRAMERRLQATRAIASRRLVGRTGRTVRPGSPIYVQVTDFDRDVSDQKDKVAVELKTASGDVLKGFALTETGPHTGSFRGAVPTGIPFPKASASATQEGKDPSVMINSTRPGTWVSLADGQKPKWVEVDTMSSHVVKAASLVLPEPKKIKQIALVGMLADDYELLAVYPKGARGSGQGLRGEYYSDTRFGRLRLTRVDPKVDFDFVKRRPHRSIGGENLSVRWTGKVQPRFSETYTFYTLSDDGARLWVNDKKLIDNWTTHGAAEDSGKIKLKAGQKHDIKLEYYQGTGDSAIRLMWSSRSQKKEVIPQGQLYPPGDEVEARPIGEIAFTDTGCTATLPQPRRVRKLRWVFDDFEGESVAVTQMIVKDADDKLVVPVKQDFTTGTTNATLEISAGDDIEVAYADEKRTRKDTPVLTATLDSSYFNGEMMLANEVITEQGDRRVIDYQPARRCRADDQLMIIVTDYDEDLTDKRDTIPVQVQTSGGERLTLKALETWVNDTSGERHPHSGVFLAVLRIGGKTEKDTIKVRPGEAVTAGYLDRENTEPGVPIERSYSIEEAGRSTPQLLVYRTTVKLAEDTSEEAKARLRRMRMRGTRTEGMVIYKEEIIARHPDFQLELEEGKEPVPPKKEEKAPPPQKPSTKLRPGAEEIAVSVNAPLLFELTYPRVALNAGSVFHVAAVAESELKAAKKAKRKPTELKVPLYIKNILTLARDKGYAIHLQTDVRRDAEQMLEDGCFAAVVRLQIGSPGDAIDDLVVVGAREFERPTERARDDYAYRVPTLLVSGSDVVHIRVKDVETGQVATTRVRLLSDGRLELLDKTYTAQKKAIHLGERFYLKLTDPDHDRTDEQDRVAVQIKSSSGDALALELAETLPHSGIFTGSVKPEFLGEKAEGKLPKPDPKDKALSVVFGDELTFAYRDERSLVGLVSRGTDAPPAMQPVDVVAKGRIHFGSDCELATFTKRFKDPEMAVKTRFLMAEALFEMAKEHRKLKQDDRAKAEIARGKRILEEAMRDYPNTSLVAQGEFLLANLAQELGRHQEAIGRYSNIISNWPDSEYAPRAQFKKAICLEKMRNYDQACEEYVKVTYIYPDSSLVADATVRLANYYYQHKRYDVAGRVFFRFQRRDPTHRLASKALFLSAQCYMKLEDFAEAIRKLSILIDEYPDDKRVRSEAMYWLGDCYFRSRNYAKAYQGFKKLTWDYPETKWAKIARGRLTEDVLAREEERQ